MRKCAGRSARSHQLPAGRQEGRRSEGARRAGPPAARAIAPARPLPRRPLMDHAPPALAPVTVLVRGRAQLVSVDELRSELDADGPPRSLAVLEAMVRSGDRKGAIARLRRIVRRGDPGVGTLQAIFGLVRLEAAEAAGDLEALAAQLGGSPGAIARAASLLVADRLDSLAAAVAEDAVLARASPQPYLHAPRVPARRAVAVRGLAGAASPRSAAPRRHRAARLRWRRRRGGVPLAATWRAGDRAPRRCRSRAPRRHPVRRAARHHRLHRRARDGLAPRRAPAWRRNGACRHRARARPLP